MEMHRPMPRDVPRQRTVPHLSVRSRRGRNSVGSGTGLTVWSSKRGQFLAGQPVHASAVATPQAEREWYFATVPRSRAAILD